MIKFGEDYDESVYYLSGNNLQDFMRVVNRFPSGNEKENLELLRRYRFGDNEARDLLVKRNLKLIKRFAKQYVNLSESYDVMDLMDEGVMGLLNGLDGFDESVPNASFTKYISKCIIRAMTDSLKKNDKLIYRSMNFSSIVIKLSKIFRECAENQEPFPDDDELCTRLKISSKMLGLAKNDLIYSYVSLNSPTNDKDENREIELIDVLDVGENKIDSLVDRIVTKELMAYLKSTLSPYKYYVLYYRVFVDKPLYHFEIANTLGVSRAAIQAIDSSTLNSLRKIFIGDNWEKVCRNTIKRKGIDIDSYNVKPVTPDSICNYLFLRDSLNTLEKKILLLGLEESFLFEEEKLAKKLNVSKRLIDVSCSSLDRKLQRVNGVMNEYYERFKKAMVESYQTSIFDVDLSMDLSTYVTYRDCINTMNEASQGSKSF